MTVDKWSDLFLFLLLLLLLLIPEPLPLPPTIAPPHHEFRCCRVSLSFDFHSSTKFSRCAFTNWVNCCTLVLNVQKRLCRVRLGFLGPFLIFLFFWFDRHWLDQSVRSTWDEIRTTGPRQNAFWHFDDVLSQKDGSLAGVHWHAYQSWCHRKCTVRNFDVI